MLVGCGVDYETLLNAWQGEFGYVQELESRFLQYFGKTNKPSLTRMARMALAILEHGGVLHLGISTGGHYASRDDEKSFAPENAGVGAGFQPDRFPEFGQCVHKIAAHPDRPERLYMQNHGGFADDPTLGVLRSDDNGKSWTSISKGLPSDFGFPIVVHPHDPNTMYVVPLETATRTCPEARPAVWRSESAGEKWQRLTDGVPKKDAWFTVLRDAMDLDDGHPSGSAQPPASFGAGAMEVTPSNASPPGSPQSIASKPPSSDP